MKKTITVAVLLLAGCGSDRDYVRSEMAESAVYINKSCGNNRECRERLAYAETARIESDLRAREGQRQRVAASLRQWSANQAAIASRPVIVAPSVNQPRNVICQQNGATTNCQAY